MRLACSRARLSDGSMMLAISADVCTSIRPAVSEARTVAPGNGVTDRKCQPFSSTHDTEPATDRCSVTLLSGGSIMIGVSTPRISPNLPRLETSIHTWYDVGALFGRS